MLGPKSQVTSDAHQPQSEHHYNTESLSSVAHEGIPVIQSHAVHLSKTIRPLPDVGCDPLAHSHGSQPRLPAQKHPLTKLHHKICGE